MLFCVDEITYGRSYILFIVYDACYIHSLHSSDNQALYATICNIFMWSGCGWVN